MLNYFRGKVQRWASRQQQQELQYFLEMLRGVDLDGRALTVAIATDFKNKVMSEPDFLESRRRETSALFLVQTYQKLQKSGNEGLAGGVAIWVHTERALLDLTLVPMVREMWSMLSDSFHLVEFAASDYELFIGPPLDIRGYKTIPAEFA